MDEVALEEDQDFLGSTGGQVPRVVVWEALQPQLQLPRDGQASLHGAVHVSVAYGYSGSRQGVRVQAGGGVASQRQLRLGSDGLPGHISQDRRAQEAIERCLCQWRAGIKMAGGTFHMWEMSRGSISFARVCLLLHTMDVSLPEPSERGLHQEEHGAAASSDVALCQLSLRERGEG